jgi:hypothetical protein
MLADDRRRVTQLKTRERTSGPTLSGPFRVCIGVGEQSNKLCVSRPEIQYSRRPVLNSRRQKKWTIRRHCGERFKGSFRAGIASAPMLLGFSTQLLGQCTGAARWEWNVAPIVRGATVVARSDAYGGEHSLSGATQAGRIP